MICGAFSPSNMHCIFTPLGWLHHTTNSVSGLETQSMSDVTSPSREEAQVDCTFSSKGWLLEVSEPGDLAVPDAG
jgi:hypothetical protein